MLKLRNLRSILLQALCLGLVVAAIAYLAINTIQNLRARGIASGFGFLSRPAGFDIAFSIIPYGEGSSFFQAFLVGLSNTLLVAALGIVGASLIGLVVALFRLASNPLLRWLGGAYVETLRNVPLLLQLFFWYFAVLRNLPPPRASLDLGELVFLNIRGLYLPFPEQRTAILSLLVALLVGLVVGHFWRAAALKQRLEKGRFPRWHLLPFFLPLGLPLLQLLIFAPQWSISVPRLEGFNFVGGLQLIPEFVALVLALSLYTASFIAEIIRAGLLAVPRGQREAAEALGLSRGDTLRLIVFPQALRVIVPPLTSQYLNLTKNSSLAAAIAFPDLVLVFAGTALNVTGQAVEIMALTMLVYLVISISISALMHRYQRRVLRYEH